MKSNENKLLAAGYRLLRTRDQIGEGGKVTRLEIRVKTGEHDWSILEKDFPSKAARERRMKELLEDDKTLEG